MNTFLDLRHLQTLRALKASGSLSRAAELLNLTQSALSHQIKALEEAYGLVLFERKSSPVIFSPGGERLLDLAEEILPRVEAAERDVHRLAQGQAGELRIAVECHTCFDWLMPAMSRFRPRWPEVEFDFISGFHIHPADLLPQGRADLAIVSEKEERPGLVFLPLFRFPIVAVLAEDHPLGSLDHLEAQDFAAETLITYPVPDALLDVVRQVLAPAGIQPPRRTSEITNAILQLVASRRGIAALPVWVVHSYLDHHGLTLKPITAQGLWGELYGVCRESQSGVPYLKDFVNIIRETSFLNLPEVELL